MDENIKKYLSEIGRKGGAVKSERKARTSAANLPKKEIMETNDAALAAKRLYFREKKRENRRKKRESENNLK